MSKNTQIQDILSKIEELDYETSIYLMEQLLNLLKTKKGGKNKKKAHLTDLNELGTEIWKDVNIDQYVERERQWD